MVQRLWGYLDSLQCPTLVVRGAGSDVVALGTAPGELDDLAFANSSVCQRSLPLPPSTESATSEGTSFELFRPTTAALR